MFNVVILHNAKITRKKIVLSLVPKWEMAYLPQKGKRKKKKDVEILAFIWTRVTSGKYSIRIRTGLEMFSGSFD